MTERELEWSRLFAFASPNPVKARTTKCTCGGKNCQTAKKIKCVCRCHSEFHGAANRKGMPKLDDLLELDGLDVFPAEPPTPEELSVW
jgi:hypothetical protein